MLSLLHGPDAATDAQTDALAIELPFLQHGVGDVRLGSGHGCTDLIHDRLCLAQRLLPLGRQRIDV
ncbi:MAG: hypothetical protein ACK55I_11250, partial [bacterium]